MMKSRVINEFVIKHLAAMLEKVDSESFPGADEFLNAMLASLENITSNTKVLFNYQHPFIKHILPALLSKFKSDLNDIKFISLKVFTDMISFYLNDSNIFNIQGVLNK